jgi:hypothetical protein
MAQHLAVDRGENKEGQGVVLRLAPSARPSAGCHELAPGLLLAPTFQVALVGHARKEVHERRDDRRADEDDPDREQAEQQQDEAGRRERAGQADAKQE